MSDRPTPETDAEIDAETLCACYPKDYVSGEFARKLERERDEARDRLRAANAMADKAKKLIARWDQPSWKDTAPTAGFIYALRDTVEAYEKGEK